MCYKEKMFTKTIPEKINKTKQRNQAKMESAEKLWHLFFL